jgi:hypothetical protein
VEPEPLSSVVIKKSIEAACSAGANAEPTATQPAKTKFLNDVKRMMHLLPFS